MNQKATLLPDARTRPLSVKRKPLKLAADPRRVITRLFIPGDHKRIRNTVNRVLSLPDDEAERLLVEVLSDYSRRHKNIRDALMENYREAIGHLHEEPSASAERKLLIGAFFTMEFAVESVALFNPSIVPDPNQNGATDGQLRVILSLRATGEGHVSSIEFRRALINEKNEFVFGPMSRYVETPEIQWDNRYEKQLFSLKLWEMSVPYDPSPVNVEELAAGGEAISRVMEQLGEYFTYEQLQDAVAVARETFDEKGMTDNGLFDRMIWLARSNYAVNFSDTSDICERVIFPVSESESRGIEDARFVRYVEDDGSDIYYATYSAYNGTGVLTQLLETRDFRHFKVNSLNGPYSASKGMALFPKKINDRYAMIGRVDGENLHLMYSDNIHFWYVAQKLRTPEESWEFTQIGNCGSPIETEKGWLLLTHGVGPMRRYAIGAVLLDLEDPSRIVGRLRDPILVPEEDEREGYVPNVVYSCGSLVHNGELIIPYAVSDVGTRIATVPMEELLARAQQS